MPTHHKVEVQDALSISDSVTATPTWVRVYDWILMDLAALVVVPPVAVGLVGIWLPWWGSLVIGLAVAMSIAGSAPGLANRAYKRQVGGSPPPQERMFLPSGVRHFLLRFFLGGAVNSAGNG